MEIWFGILFSILLLSILPLYYKYSFWLYLLQLKEYRYDRMKEYLWTYQGRKTLFHPICIVEGVLLFCWVIIIIWYFSQYSNALGGIFLLICIEFSLLFLVLYSLFVAYKVLKHNYKKPIKTSRLFLTIFTTWWILALILWFGFITFFDNFLFFWLVFFCLFFAPAIILFANFLLIPVANTMKEKKYSYARKIIQTDKECIKIGITGSFGKSSVKEYLAHILSSQGKTLKTPENINTELGISDFIQRNFRKNTFKYFVCEMWAYKRWEIQKMWEIVEHQHGFLTAIGTQHIALFGSQENIKKGKSEIALSPSMQEGRVYANIDSEEAKKLDFSLYPRAEIITYGLEKNADVFWEIVKISQSGTKFRLHFWNNILDRKKDVFSFSTNLIGRHHISNLAGVISFCLQEWMWEEEIQESLLSLPLPDHTLSIIKQDSVTLIDDSYNLSQESLMSGIEVLSHFQWEKILVLDDILELGTRANETHKELAKKIVKDKIIDTIFYVWENYKEYFFIGLREAWFPSSKIVSKLEKTTKKRAILFEWRRSQKYLQKFL